MENVNIYVYIYIYIRIGKAGLEDLTTFHESEFEVFDGYYINSGRENKTNNIVKNLCGLRLKSKKEILHKL